MLEIKNLNYGYDEQSTVINGLSVSIESGKLYAIVGSNGSGKSTLCKVIAGVLKKSSGEITLDGKELANSDVAIVFQNPTDQFVRPTVYDDLAFGLENASIPIDEIQSMIYDIANKFNIKSLLDRSVNSLSGGERQRVAIIGNLLLNPKVLILDEATDMLDPITRHDLLVQIEKFAIENNTILIYITHDMELAAALDQIIIVDNGQVIAQEKPDNIFNNEELVVSSRLIRPFSIELGMQLTGSYKYINKYQLREDYEIKPR